MISCFLAGLEAAVAEGRVASGEEPQLVLDEGPAYADTEVVFLVDEQVLAMSR